MRDELKLTNVAISDTSDMKDMDISNLMTSKKKNE
jgi:hypothetical protein